jgi:hypothetical protein
MTIISEQKLRELLPLLTAEGMIKVVCKITVADKEYEVTGFVTKHDIELNEPTKCELKVIGLIELRQEKKV